MTTNEEMIDLYGPAATHAEHRRFDRIRYTDQEHREATGTIIWLSAPTPERGLRYVVEGEQHTGFPDMIGPGDVLEVLSPEEPTLVPCPYCLGRHPAGTVEQCPLNPHRQA